MGRRFHIISVLSLLLCLAVVGFWVRSYWRCDLFNWTRQYGQQVTITSLEALQGRAMLGRTYTDSVSYSYMRPGPRYSNIPAETATSIDSLPSFVRASGIKRANWDFRFAGFDFYAVNGDIWWIV